MWQSVLHVLLLEVQKAAHPGAHICQSLVSPQSTVLSSHVLCLQSFVLFWIARTAAGCIMFSVVLQHRLWPLPFLLADQSDTEQLAQQVTA